MHLARKEKKDSSDLRAPSALCPRHALSSLFGSQPDMPSPSRSQQDLALYDSFASANQCRLRTKAGSNCTAAVPRIQETRTRPSLVRSYVLYGRSFFSARTNSHCPENERGQFDIVRTRGLAFANSPEPLRSPVVFFIFFQRTARSSFRNRERRASQQERSREAQKLSEFCFSTAARVRSKNRLCPSEEKGRAGRAQRGKKKKRWSHWSVKQLGLVETLSPSSFPHHRDSRTTRSTLNRNGRRELIRLPLPVTTTFSNTIRLALDPIHREKKNTL